MTDVVLYLTADVEALPVPPPSVLSFFLAKNGIAQKVV
jgi:hypothetical protein